MRFVGEHLRLRPARPPALLPADLFHAILLGRDHAALPPLDLVREASPGEEAVHALRARLLAAHAHAGRPVHEDHARGRLVHVLAAGTARADEALVEVLLADAEAREASLERRFLVARDGGRHPIALAHLSKDCATAPDPRTRRETRGGL